MHNAKPTPSSAPKKNSPPSNQRVGETRDVLHPAAQRVSALPCFERDDHAPAHVSLLDLFELMHHGAIIDEQRHFAVERERADVQITRSDHGDLIVDGSMLCVQKRTAVQMNVYAGR